MQWQYAIFWCMKKEHSLDAQRDFFYVQFFLDVFFVFFNILSSLCVDAL